jgi:hypothetical protein
MPSAWADSNDDAYLAALQDGGLCCPEQLDITISYAGPAMTTAAIVTYAYDQIDQARAELNAVSK